MYASREKNQGSPKDIKYGMQPIVGKREKCFFERLKQDKKWRLHSRVMEKTMSLTSKIQ
jgi:hypothetical protein